MVGYYFELVGSGVPLNTVCGYDESRHAGFVMSEIAGGGDFLTDGGGGCKTRLEGSLSISDAEQAACAPLAAQIVTALGQPCDIFP
jgi:hypothetical protein